MDSTVESTDDELWDYYSGLPNPMWYQHIKEIDEEINTNNCVNTAILTEKSKTKQKIDMKIMNNEEVIKAQKDLIELLESQVMDLTMMSKIELGDDVIEEIVRLKKLIQ